MCRISSSWIECRINYHLARAPQPSRLQKKTLALTSLLILLVCFMHGLFPASRRLRHVVELKQMSNSQNCLDVVNIHDDQSVPHGRRWSLAWFGYIDRVPSPPGSLDQWRLRHWREHVCGWLPQSDVGRSLPRFTGASHERTTTHDMSPAPTWPQHCVQTVHGLQSYEWLCVCKSVLQLEKCPWWRKISARWYLSVEWESVGAKTDTVLEQTSGLKQGDVPGLVGVGEFQIFFFVMQQAFNACSMCVQSLL